MRARWLKPEFFKDRKIGALGPIAALVYEALWCMADDGGTAPCDPEVIKGEMFVHWPMITILDIENALKQLFDTKRIVFYQGSDELFGYMPKFEDHQNTHNKAKHRYSLLYNDFHLVVPSFCVRTNIDDGSPTIADSCPNLLTSYTPTLLDSNTPVLCITEAKRKKREKDEYDAGFDALWATYPRRAGGDPKKRAYHAYKARIEAGFTHEVILAGVERYAAYCKATDKLGTEYVKMAATFLGPNEDFLLGWDIPAQRAQARRPTPGEIQRQIIMGDRA